MDIRREMCLIESYRTESIIAIKSLPSVENTLQECPDNGHRSMRYVTNLMALLIELSSTRLRHVECHLSGGVESLWPLERAASQDRLAPTNRLLQTSTDTVTVEGRH